MVSWRGQSGLERNVVRLRAGSEQNVMVLKTGSDVVLLATVGF